MPIIPRQFQDERTGRHPIINTMRGDTPTQIGDGKVTVWNFANGNDIVTDSITTTIPSGKKRKRLEIGFNENVKIRGEKLYFKNAPVGCFIDLWKVCLLGGHYEDPNGTINGATIGRNPKKMYTLAASDTPVTHFVVHYFIVGSTNEGIRLNKDDDYEFGLLRRQDNFALWFEITTDNSDSASAGFAELEIRRPRTRLLPGESV